MGESGECVTAKKTASIRNTGSQRKNLLDELPEWQGRRLVVKLLRTMTIGLCKENHHSTLYIKIMMMNIMFSHVSHDV